MPEKLPVTLQMYTVRDDAAQDFAATIEAVAKIGYAGVELAGYGSLKSAEEVRRVLDSNNLFVAGMHTGLQQLESDLPQAIEDALTLGNEYIVCPYLPEERRGSVDDYRRLASILNPIGQTIKDAGLQLCYHNHAFEFEKFDGDGPAWDVFLNALDAELVKIELDTFWVARAGYSPSEYLRKNPGRTPLVHLKDMTAGDNPTFAEVGEGIMDYPSIFAAAETAGAKFYVVEQDRCEKHAPLESIAISYRNLQKMGMA